MTTKKPRDPHLLVIAERVRGLDAVFSCDGTMDLPAPLALRFRDGSSARFARDSTHERAFLRSLKEQCTPAPFGVGNETRRDPDVRDGGQLLARDGGLSVEGLDLERSGILEEVRRVLCPGSARLPEAELYALNLYDGRGHFVRHKDTPRDCACFGTLVVCLPVRFQGGRLVLHQEGRRVYDWGVRDYYFTPGDESRLHWVAFYGDVDHEVERVGGGTRVTLTWLLRHSEDCVVPPEPASNDADLETALREAIRDARFMPDGGLIGIPCLHLYSETKGFIRPASALTSTTASRLKGRDRQVAFAAMRSGLPIRYRPYLYEDQAFDKWRLSRAPSDSEVDVFDTSRLGESELAREMPVERGCSGWDPIDDVTWLLPSRFGRSFDRVAPAPEHPVPAAKFLGEVHFSATDYFGNESADSTFYVSAALLIDVPAALDRETTPSVQAGSSSAHA